MKGNNDSTTEKNCNKKHLNSNQFFAVALKEYYLLYPDAELVVITPGEKNLFTVARYKGFLGKQWVILQSEKNLLIRENDV